MSRRSSGSPRRSSGAPEESLRLTVQGLAGPTRIDRFLRDRFPAWGRKETGRLIGAGQVQVNGKKVHLASWEVRNGDRLAIANPPAARPDGPTRFDPAWLLEDDGALLAVNKPAGLLSEPTRWGEGTNLRDLAAAFVGEPLEMAHRLDRDTSGVIVLARPGDTKRWLDAQFRTRTAHKQYVAVVHAPNELAAEGEIRAPLAPDPARDDRMRVVRAGGRPSLTCYRTQPPAPGRGGAAQWVDLWPETGRTHQLRVHLAHMGAPILGDRLYGDPASAPRLMLHALSLWLPGRDGGPPRRFDAPLPPEFLPFAPA